MVVAGALDVVVEVISVVAVEVGLVVVAVAVAVEMVVVAATPKALLIVSRNPEFVYSWLASHIMTPPKLEYCFEYEITFATQLAGSYPPPAPEAPGTPRRTFTLGFLLTVLAQLSHVAKLKPVLGSWVDPCLNELMPQ